MGKRSFSAATRSAPVTKRDQDSEMSKAAKIVLDMALDRAWEPEQYAAIEKLRKVFDPDIGYMGLTDDEAGRYMKWIGSIAMGFAKEEFDDHDGTGTALTTMGILQVLKRVRDAGAHHGTFVVNKATFGGEDGGNWRLTIEQIDDNGVPITFEDTEVTTMSKLDPISPDHKPTVDGSGNV